MQPPNVPYFLKIKESTIPGAGMGMFATRKLQKGKILGRYVGEVISQEQAMRERRDESYFIHTLEDDVFIDGKTLENPMRWANHDPVKFNARAIINDDGHVFFETTKVIPSGKEIFIDYGYEPGK